MSLFSKPLWPRLTSLTLASSLLLAQALPGFALLANAQEADPKPLNGGVVVTDRLPNQSGPNPGELVTVEKGDLLEMKISTTISDGLSLEGDEFFGKLSRDYTLNGKLVLPHGTIVHGVVEGMTDPKRMGRDGHIQLKFDYLITPDGREIALDGNATTRDSTGLAAAKVVGRAAGFTLAGGLVGTLIVLKVGGLAAVAASNGYALAGGAAVGGAVGLGIAMATKGKQAVIPPGAELKIRLQEGLQLPTMTASQAETDTKKLEGLSVQFMETEIGRDPFGEKRELTLMVDIANETPTTFSMFEVALVDEYGQAFYPSPFGDTGMWFGRISPNSRMKGRLSFEVDDPKLQHYLVFYKPYTRELMAKIAVPLAQSATELADTGKRGKKH